jgi:hypothetical protein
VAAPSAPREADWLLLMQMLEVLERQLAAGECRNYIEAARVVAPIWNAARLSGRITTQTSRESALLGDIVRVTMRQANVAGRLRYAAPREKEIADRHKVHPLLPEAVLARYKKLRNRNSPAGRALWAMLSNPDVLERRLKRIGSRWPSPRNRTKTP